MNKAYKYTLTANEHKEITFDVGVNRLAISNANGTDGDVTVVTSEITKTDSGEICSFVDGADAPFAELSANIVATQSGSGDPSPTNVRPISGFTGANVSRARKNIFDYNAIKSISIGTSARNGMLFYKTGVYSISAQNGGGYCYGRVFNADGTIKETHYIIAETIITPITISIVSGEYFAVYDAVGSETITQSKTAFAHWQVQVEMSSSPTAYEPYNGNTVEISWQDEAGTVYGGNVKPLTGELTVTHANIASYDGETINEPWISSMDVYSAGATPTTGAQVVYPLTIPVTYQLTPVEIRSLLGQNNIWADCGNISLKYFVQSTQPLIDYINDEDDKCVYIECAQTGADTFSITSDITKAEFASLLSKNKNVKLRLDTGSSNVIYDLSYADINYVEFTYNRATAISDVNTFQSMTLRVDMSGDTLTLSRRAVITIGDGSYEYVTGQNNQLIKDGWSWSTQGYDLRDADELLFIITPMPNVASDSDTINGELQRSSQDPKRALFCKGVKNMLPEVQEIESPFWFNDIVVVGNRATYTSKNDIVMKIRVWANYYSSPQHSLADVNFYANCDCSDGTANLWGSCNVFVFKKKR